MKFMRSNKVSKGVKFSYLDGESKKFSKSDKIYLNEIIDL